MADKSQNITINYKFNTAEIDKANAILNRANQATNNLQASGQKAGQQIGSGFKIGTQSLLEMNNQLARLKSQIEVSTNPKRIADLSNQFKALKTQIDAANKSLLQTPKALNQTKQATQSATQGFGSLFTAVKLFITAGVAKEMVDIALAAASLSGRVEGVEKAFNRTFPNAIRLLEDLRNATHGTQTDLDLMQKTLQAKNLGIPVEQLATFFQFAATRAQQTGVSVEYLTEAIVNGLGRKSTRVLDNLGISATRIKEEFHGVSLEQLSVAEVSQGVANIIRQEMGKMGDYVETAATKVDQLGVSFNKLKEEASELATQEGGIIDVMKSFVDSFSLGVEAINKDISVQELANQKRDLATALIREEDFARRELTGTQEENIQSIEDEIASLTKQLGLYARMRQDTQARLQDLEDEKVALREQLALGKISQSEFHKQFDLIKEQILLENRLRNSHKEDIAVDQEILKLLQGRLAALKQITDVEEKESSGIISRKKAEIEALEKQIELTNDLNDLGRATINPNDDSEKASPAGRLLVQLEILKAELAELTTVFNDFKLKPAFKIELEKGTKTISGVTYEVQRFKSELGTTARQSDEFIAKVTTIEEAMKKLASTIQTVGVSGLGNIRDEFGDVFSKPPKTFVEDPSFWESLGEAFEENWQEIAGEITAMTEDLFSNIAEADLNSLKNRLSVLRNYYDEQQLLAGNNERKKKELRLKEERETAALQKRIFEKEKQTRKANAVIDGAAAVVKAFVTAPNFYVALIQSAIIAAKTIAEITTINRQKSGYAKGVIDIKGPGTTTSDSIPVNVSKHESIMTAWETQHAGDVLKDIRAKRLDNKILKGLKQGRAPIQTQQFNDKAIIKAIEKNSPPDIVEQSGIVFRVEKRNETYHRKIRSKSINL